MVSRVASLAFSALVTIGVSASAASADSGHQANVERNSEHVMPFRMDTTLHHFAPTPNGGVQSVVVRNGDPKQVILVRSHLRKEARAFARGDFADPASIHGGSMPGLTAMHSGAKRISVHYTEVRNGAAITYSTSEPRLVAAIHAWFSAQVSDHGSHATMHM